MTNLSSKEVVPLRVALIEEDPELRDRIVFFLESTYECQIFSGANVKEILTVLKTANLNPHIIVLGGEIDKKMADFRKFLRTRGEGIPVCVFNQDQLKGFKNFFGEDYPVIQLDKQELTRSLTRFLKVLSDGGAFTLSPPLAIYCRINARILQKVYPLKGDIFIKLSDKKYVKLFQTGDQFESDDYKKYTLKKGIEYFYIPKDQCRDFAKFYVAELERLLISGSVEDLEQASELTHEAVQELIEQVGFTEEVQTLAKKQVQVTMKAMGSTPRLAKVLAQFANPDGKYIASHSNALAYIACAIASAMDWTTESTYQKLTLASFLHDLPLTNEKLAPIQSMKELEEKKSQFTDAEIKQFKDHPRKAAELARAMSEVPPDVDTIVFQHHEKPDGSGFPRGITHAHISPLGSAFIIAHDLVQFVRKSGGKINIDAFLESARKRYTFSHFRKILKRVEEIKSEI